MERKCAIKKSCSFYINDMHFATMVMPFINKQVENGVKFITFLENNYENNIELVLERTLIKEEQKRKILNIRWRENKTNKYVNVEKILKEKIEKDKENIIIVNGNKEYINMMHDFLEKFFAKHNYNESTTIFIMDFYEVGIFNDNIADILDTHEIIFNTSGEHKIEDVFERKKAKIKIN